MWEASPVEQLLEEIAQMQTNRTSGCWLSDVSCDYSMEIITLTKTEETLWGWVNIIIVFIMSPPDSVAPYSLWWRFIHWVFFFDGHLPCNNWNTCFPFNYIIQ